MPVRLGPPPSIIPVPCRAGEAKRNPPYYRENVMAGFAALHPPYGVARLSREGQEAFVGGENVSLHVVLDHRLLLIERLHRAGERHPVQHLVLPGILHLIERALSPGAPIGAADRIEQDAVALMVGPQIAVLRRQEAVRPAG